MHPAECVLAHDVHFAAHNVSIFTLAVSSVDFQLSLESEGVGSAYPDQPLAATADETVGTVLQLLRAQRTGAVVMMAEGAYRHLPIVDQNQKPTGMLAVHGIVHYLVDHFPETVYNLPPDTKAARAREGA